MRGKPFKVCSDVYMIGDSSISHPYDCSVYLIDTGQLVMIDAGAGLSFDELLSNIQALGLDLDDLKAVLVTHAHIDHIGSLKRFRDEFGAQIIAHELDADRIESGSGVGAEMYGVPYIPCPVELRLRGAEDSLWFGRYEIRIVHIPGHTLGSIAAYVDTDDGRVLFGQDIHGPYLPEWGSDREKGRRSLQKLIDLKADILCEGHFGVYRGAAAVEEYIRGYMMTL